METTTHKGSPRDVFLHLLSILTLYVSVWRFIDLWFEYINTWYPDPALSYFFDASYSVRWDMSVLLIVFPVYLGLTWFLRKDAIAHPEKREMRIRKWLLNLTLFLTAIMIIADLVTVLNTFFEGELTARFVFKVLVALVTAAAVFSYYLWDLRRSTSPESRPSKIVAAIAGLTVLASIVAGFFIIGSPATQRKYRFDEQRVNDLSTVQNEIINYWTQKAALPGRLGDLKNSISGFAPPTDPDTNTAYGYTATGGLTFDLCANFNLASRKNAGGVARPYPYYAPDVSSQDWEHPAGRFCFSRTIDPDIYRPLEPKRKD